MDKFGQKKMFDQLLSELEPIMAQVQDHRKTKPSYALKDCLLSGLAMFCLKDPSLLSFIENYETRKENLEQVFKISKIPSDNGLRKILDSVDPNLLLPCFQGLIKSIDNQGLIKKYEYIEEHLLLSIDGTGYFCSNEISCPHCMVKNRKKNGETYQEYYHQMLTGCIVHPEHKAVFPVFGEAITKQDGAKKNDCERNASKRFLPNIRKVLPDKKILVLLDALYADGPTVRNLLSNEMDYMIVIKEGYVLIQVAQLKETTKLQSHSWKIIKKNKAVSCTAKWASKLTLNGANQDLEVHYLEYEEIEEQSGKVLYSNKWITNIEPIEANVEQLVKAGRSRWKIENETFNTLKNQGYNLEHNFGHGKKYLSTVFALLMLLAFFIDQITQALDTTFDKALKAAKTLRDLRQKVRVLFDLLPTISMNFIYKIIAKEIFLQPPQ